MIQENLRSDTFPAPLSGDAAEASLPVIRALEEEVLPRLQCGEETYLVVAGKQPQVVVLPPWPGAALQKSSAQFPRVHSSEPVRERWRKEPLLGFVYVIRGEAELLLSNRVVSCHAGNFVFFLPHTWSDRGTSARWKQAASGRADCDLLWLYLRPQEVLCHLSWLRGAQHTGSRHLFIPDNRVLALAELLHEEVSADAFFCDDCDGEYYSENVLSGATCESAPQLLWLITDRVRRKLREGSFLANRLSVQEVFDSGETIENPGQRAQKYVDANLMQRMTLESVARAVFTSRARLAREFRAHTGETFGSYLLRCRIERAQILLATTDYSIKEVAWRTGFSDPDYFSTAFRRSVGSTPTEFRKKIR